MDKDGYPEVTELEKIEKWKLVKLEDLCALIEYIRCRWQYEAMGYFDLRGKNVLKLTLSTAGWSGNESIISALQRNFIFWSVGWRKSERGGHFWFTFKKSQFR